MVVVARTKRLRDAMIGVSLGSTIVLHAMVKFPTTVPGIETRPSTLYHNYNFYSYQVKNDKLKKIITAIMMITTIVIVSTTVK
jgi:predicted alpha/beta superfamily hydrolase